MDIAMNSGRKYKTNFKFITMKTDVKPTENTAENGNKSKPLLPAVFLSGEDKRQQFIKEFRELLTKFKAEICIEDFGSGYNTNEKIVIDFEWDEDLSKKVESGIVEQLVIGRYENGR